MSTKQLTGLSIFFFIFNGIVSGFLYTWLKFDLLSHATGTGAIPGPWLIIPLLSTLVIAGSVTLASFLYVLLKATKWFKIMSYLNTVLMSFIVSSVFFHLWIIFIIVMDPNYYS